ncbi:MAG: hypothetical protein Q4B28_01875 [bacterium]|nr:hypothetical protein [bacterium]
MLEALEQSYGWQLPQLQMLTDWQQIAQEYQLRVFDLPESNTPPASCMHKHQKSDLPPLGIIGPE